MNEHIYKLFRDYDRSESKLIQRRDIEFPVGTKVYSKLTDTSATVIGGSLYADQVNTTSGHMGWRNLERANDSNDEASK